MALAVKHHIEKGDCFGLLTALGEQKSIRGHRHYLFICQCGKQTTKRVSHVIQGNVQSCGCGKMYANRTHGFARTYLFDLWSRIKQRCYNVNDKSYKNYGARGIVMCPEWKRDFLTFANDVGERPSLHHSLDRWPNNDGNYAPGNVRWATVQEQNKNKRATRIVNIDGVAMCLKDACRKKGTIYQTAQKRLKRGWSLHEAVCGRD